MCGLAGYITSAGFTAEGLEAGVRAMSERLVHRGPNDFGVWQDAQEGIALAHRRLSIVDLSSAGHQPMVSECGRYVLALNGEIYNHLEVRTLLDGLSSKSRELQGVGLPNWRGLSDTETLLAGISVLGIQSTLERCVGMFAFALWDREDRVITLARDRMGEKPLYYGWQGSGNTAAFLFASELSALRAHPFFSAGIDRSSLSLMMRHSYIPAPHSIYQGIYKLLPGHWLTVSLDKREPFLTQYWSLAEVAERGVSEPFIGGDEAAVNQLEVLLKDAVKQQMMADVPLGAFLSGGVDSSTIVALMQAQSSKPVKTFTIGFNEASYNEASHAKAVALYLGTEHTELYVTPQEAQNVIPRLPLLYNEPFSDVSQIPTFLVSQLASQQVTVALSGDAGDELFAGYNRYILSLSLWNKLSRMPRSLRSMLAASISCLSPMALSILLDALLPFLPLSMRQANVVDKLQKGAGVLSARSIDDLYLGLVTNWDPNKLVIGGQEPLTCLNGERLPLVGLDAVQRMMALDAITYLPDDVLVKVDRATMGVALEGRVPFLDHRIVEFAWTLPQHMKLRDGVGKWALRQVLYRYVPHTLIERPKMGFGVPIGNWLCGPLRDWAENLLDESKLRQQGFFQTAIVRQKWSEHLSGQRNWQHHLWSVLMYQAWLESQRD